MRNIISIAVCLFVLLACQDMKSQKEMTEMTASGYRMSMLKDVDGPSAKVGNFVLLHAVMAHGDSILSDTRVNPGRPTVVPMEEPEQRRNSSSAPIQDLLERMSPGDSARIYYPLDSFKMKPERLKAFDEVSYDISVLEIFNTEAEMQNYFAAEREKAEAEMADTKKQENAIAEKVADIYATYKSNPGSQEWQTTDSGLKYMILEHGKSGKKANRGDLVRANYYGIFEADGAPFDNSYKRGTTFDFTIGVDPVIKGWEEGFQLLEKGDKAVLMVPGDLAYGSQGYPGVIPPDAVLIFYVELLSVGEME